MKQATQLFKHFKFGVFEANPRTGELTKLGNGSGCKNNHSSC
jgi:hypothetical protein